jgi:hypothetical protein
MKTIDALIEDIIREQIAYHTRQAMRDWLGKPVTKAVTRLASAIEEDPLIAKIGLFKARYEAGLISREELERELKAMKRNGLT